jgi:hypothetical protein
MQLTCPDLSSRQAPGRSTAAIEQDVERSGMPADKPATVNAQFQPPDPGVVSEAVPAGGADARRATVMRFFISALMVVAAGLALVAIMALKIIAYLPRFH